ncbi:MAG: T9SS type A sorting domain-containing protein [Ignavibacterium sp.]
MKNFSTLLIVISLSLTSANAQWIPVDSSNLGGDIMALLEYNGVLYAGGTAYLYRSSDGGLNWTGHFPQLAFAWSLAKSDSQIYCGISYSPSLTPGVYRSDDNGLNWISTTLSNKNIMSLAADSTQVLASADRIYRSTDNGQSWFTISHFTGYLNISGNRIYSALSGLRVTTDFGANWNIIKNDGGVSVVAEDSIIFFGTQDGIIYRSTDFGQSWETKFNKPGAYVYSLYKYGQNIFAGTDSGFYVSINDGESFFSKNDNLGQSRIQAIMVYNNYVFVGNGNYGAVPVSVWKRPLNEILNADEDNSDYPEEFSLAHNYPNPFNPVTKIRYTIPASSPTSFKGEWTLISLKVYDVLGNEVGILVNEEKPAGVYEVDFDASTLPSGIYFYKLQAGKYSETKKMILIN